MIAIIIWAMETGVIEVYGLAEQKQIDLMIERHNSFMPKEKPEWITMDEILEYQEILCNMK